MCKCGLINRGDYKYYCTNTTVPDCALQEGGSSLLDAKQSWLPIFLHTGLRGHPSFAPGSLLQSPFSTTGSSSLSPVTIYAALSSVTSMEVYGRNPSCSLPLHL